jgi:hypothetical protein
MSLNTNPFGLPREYGTCSHSYRKIMGRLKADAISLMWGGCSFRIVSSMDLGGHTPVFHYDLDDARSDGIEFREGACSNPPHFQNPPGFRWESSGENTCCLYQFGFYEEWAYEVVVIMEEKYLTILKKDDSVSFIARFGAGMKGECRYIARSSGTEEQIPCYEALSLLPVSCICSGLIFEKSRTCNVKNSRPDKKSQQFDTPHS